MKDNSAPTGFAAGREGNMAKKQEYGNESITSLKGADRVRKRPAVIFGSDGVEGCAHSIFEIVSNSIDEARDGHGDTINVTRCKDGSVMVEDFGRGMPVYYTAEGDEAHNFIVVVEDNFGNSYELEFDFNNRNVKDDGVISVVPIGNFKPLLR